MSLEAMVWALRDAPVPDATARVVLMGLANHAGPDGRTAFPNVATLAHYVQCSERTVHRKLTDLLEAGVIRRGDQRYVEHLRSDRRPVVYDLNLTVSRGDTVTPGESHGVTTVSGREDHGVTPEAERGDTGGIHGVTTVSDRTVLEPSLELTTSSPYVSTSPGRGEGEQAFERFWNTHPRAERLAATERAWAEALKRTDPRTLIEAARRYAEHVRDGGTEPRYVTSSANWLSTERWKDRLPEPPVRFVTREERMHSEPPVDRRPLPMDRRER